MGKVRAEVLSPGYPHVDDAQFIDDAQRIYFALVIFLVSIFLWAWWK